MNGRNAERGFKIGVQISYRKLFYGFGFSHARVGAGYKRNGSVCHVAGGASDLANPARSAAVIVIGKCSAVISYDAADIYVTADRADVIAVFNLSRGTTHNAADS